MTTPYIQLRDEKANKTDGGASLANTWSTRVINTKTWDTNSNCTLASNQFALLAGTYDIDASVAFYATNATGIRLQNITDSTTTMVGLCTYQLNGAPLYLRGRFVIAGTTTFEIQYICQTVVATFGLGVSIGNARAIAYLDVETYLVVDLWKVA